MMFYSILNMWKISWKYVYEKILREKKNTRECAHTDYKHVKIKL